nr:hypothetical protein GCM10020092_051400 [Actinoplanes digitatis]
MSTETTARSRAASTTGSTRRSSSSTLTSGPGANGTPPMSIQSAPAPAAARTASTAFSRANVRPWSWNESGVRLTIAMTATRREKSKARPPMTRSALISGGA